MTPAHQREVHSRLRRLPRLHHSPAQRLSGCAILCFLDVKDTHGLGPDSIRRRTRNDVYLAANHHLLLGTIFIAVFV